MPGFDGTGPAGRGPMTGGGFGRCNPYGRSVVPIDDGPEGVWGRGRGYRHRYWATGLLGWMRSGPGRSWGYRSTVPFTKEDEVRFLKEQAQTFKEELHAIDSRLRDLELEGKRSE